MAANGEEDLVFESAAELFGLLSTPVRLKIVSAVCNGERNVSELLEQINTTPLLPQGKYDVTRVLPPAPKLGSAELAEVPNSPAGLLAA